MSKNNENKLVPKLRFPEFLKSEGWTNIRIGNIAQVSAGGTPESTNSKYWGGEIPWMNSGELNNKRIYSVSNYITKKGYDESSTKLIPPKCILIGLAGQGKTRGTAAINYIELCTNQSIGAIHPNPEVFESEFLYHKIDSLYEKLRKLSAGDGGRGGLNLKIIKSIQIPIPSLKEQQKIAACLSSLDEVVTAESQKLEVLKEQKKGLLQNLFPKQGEVFPRIRFKEFEQNGDWKETTLTQVGDYENGKAHEQEIDENGEYVVVNSKFISSDGEVKKFTSAPFCIAQKGDILMVLSDVPNGKAIAKCFLVEEDNLYTVNQRICRVTPRNTNSKILYYRLNRNPYFLAFDDGVKQTNLRKEDVLNCPLLIPDDPKEQQKIASTLSSIDDLIIAQGQKLEALQLHKKGLLQGLFPNLNEVTE
ncbi:restriction endonuclease subunit S [Flectobacillus sp. DC10W]|uniref:Restriction endonuclease subunit S n=1 Tax=Flectobacillus longus TaxID=2984207 RepID=A0ABT6YJ32_9BACT|nr:restriction endonuclease subunit S [Flectobacillus longus]MDI9863594.1 restriction endonuclease subunit S [Flectobacillus longus]